MDKHPQVLRQRNFKKLCRKTETQIFNISQSSLLHFEKLVFI